MGTVQQLRTPRRPSRSGDVSLLVSAGIKRDMEQIRQAPPLRLPRQKAGHIGALHPSRLDAGPHGGDRGVQFPLRPELMNQQGQPLYMLEQRVALPQAQSPLGHLQQPSQIIASHPVEQGH